MFILVYLLYYLNIFIIIFVSSSILSQQCSKYSIYLFDNYLKLPYIVKLLYKSKIFLNIYLNHFYYIVYHFSFKYGIFKVIQSGAHNHLLLLFVI